MSASKPLVWRLVLGPILIAAIVGVMLLDHHNRTIFGVRVLVGLTCILALREFYVLCRAKGHRPDWAGMVFLCTSPLLWHGTEIDRLPEFLIQYSWMIFLLYVLVRYIIGGEAASLGLTVLGCAYVSMIAVMFLPLRAGDEAFTFYFFFLFFTAKGSDMAAFLVGKAIGKHPLAPNISPNKTWEGAIAGAIVGTGAGTAFLFLSPLNDAYAFAPAACLPFFALLVTIAAQVGDLVESKFKRWAGAKDSAGLLPGFGGILDMADSFFVSVPVAFLATEVMRLSF